MQMALRFLLTAGLITLAAHLSKKSSLVAAILISLPLASILTLCWNYYDQRDAGQTAQLSAQIGWMVLPSLLFFAALTFLLRRGLPFPWAMLSSCAIMAAAYAGYTKVLARFGLF